MTPFERRTFGFRDPLTNSIIPADASPFQAIRVGRDVRWIRDSGFAPLDQDLPGTI
ncbi:hypothetical protein [Tautonia marina]|uniref:hypothetical protein n=1 Tax=Tautonia marina TaxID=2653855 RepID=UPI0013762D94|nr:hypothetical protein [Tautonia marina]